MKKINAVYVAILFAFAILTSCGGSSNDKQAKTIIQKNSETKIETQQEIRFDGLYQSETDIDSRKFLRFYSDSTVISVSSTGEATDVIKWFKKGWDNEGKFEVKGNNIYFTTTSPSGSVVYEGLIESEYKLKLKMMSLINGHVSEELYYFIKSQ